MTKREPAIYFTTAPTHVISAREARIAFNASVRDVLQIVIPPSLTRAFDERDGRGARDGSR
jgi:hypothetical protein